MVNGVNTSPGSVSGKLLEKPITALFVIQYISNVYLFSSTAFVYQCIATGVYPLPCFLVAGLWHTVTRKSRSNLWFNIFQIMILCQVGVRALALCIENESLKGCTMFRGSWLFLSAPLPVRFLQFYHFRHLQTLHLTCNITILCDYK